MAQKIHLRNGQAFPPKQSLSKGLKETAEWVSHDTAYKVDFGNDSPFGNALFDIPAKGSKDSGAITRPPRELPYSYTLTQAGSASGGDPDVEILP